MNITTDVKKVAIYSRVSTVEKAEEGFSLDEQERLIHEYCANHHMEVVEVYQDAGIEVKILNTGLQYSSC